MKLVRSAWCGGGVMEVPIPFILNPSDGLEISFIVELCGPPAGMSPNALNT